MKGGPGRKLWLLTLSRSLNPPLSLFGVVHTYICVRTHILNIKIFLKNIEYFRYKYQKIQYVKFSNEHSLHTPSKKSLSVIFNVYRYQSSYLFSFLSVISHFYLNEYRSSLQSLKFSRIRIWPSGPTINTVIVIYPKVQTSLGTVPLLF